MGCIFSQSTSGEVCYEPQQVTYGALIGSDTFISEILIPQEYCNVIGCILPLYKYCNKCNSKLCNYHLLERQYTTRGGNLVTVCPICNTFDYGPRPRRTRLQRSK